MEGAVQVDPGAGQVTVGVERHACLLADGDIVVHGCRLRPVTVGERALAVALAGHGSGRPGRLATLVWQASSGEPGAPPASVAAALEAIALHLAGAAATGPLTRTLVLVSRALGATPEAVQAMAAIAADDLAASVAGALGEGETEDGWTSISFASDPVEPVGLTAAEVRDVLAERLVRRADDPLEPGVLDIGGTGESPSTPGAFSSSTSGGRVATAASGGSGGDEGERRHADRWGAPVAATIAATSAAASLRPAPAGEYDVVVPPVGGAKSASPGSPPGLRRGRPGVAAVTEHPPSIAAPQEPAPAAGFRGPVGHEAAITGTARDLSSRPGMPAGRGPGRVAMDAESGGGWGAAAAADGEQGGRGGSAAASVANTPELGARVARLLGLPFPDRPGAEAQAVVGDVLAMALHEAADLRGVAR